MTVLGSEAWITSAVEDGSVNKALVLAGSLRRVHTGKKLVVVTSFGVAPNLREKLKDAFDLVVLIEHDNPNGMTLEDYAKVEGFSLLIFNKCVYLSPDTVVLRNCDEMFDKYESFAVLRNEMGVDSSVFLFTPSVDIGKALRNFMHHAGSHEMNGDIEGNHSKRFNMWIQNNIPKLEKLDEEYNTNVDVKGKSSNRMSSISISNISIVNFGDIHPLDLALGEISDDKLNGLGTTEKFLIDFCQQILVEDVKPNNNLYTDLSLEFDVYKKEPIAIVGMSFRLPGGNNAEEFWNLLLNGREGITSLPPNRWRKEQTIWPRPNKNVEAGFLTVPVDEFDPDFFGISKKEAEYLDPQTRLLHEVAWEALEDAMVDPKSIRGTNTGVFVGSWLQDYRDMLTKSSDADFSPAYMGSSIAAGAGGLSNFLGVRGPNVGTESGCSSAIVAVDMACKSLRSRESSMALACGVNLLLHPFDYETLNVVLSPDGRCKTFDEGANGFARAEGCVVLLLKRLSDASRDGDNIWGLIRGSAATQEGVSKSLGTPTIHCESLAMELALKDAGVDPLDVSYVEAHGTGTPVGDPMEIAAITKAYGKGRSEPLVIGSVKTNVGHTESVSGITGIVKVLLSMKNEIIPKHLNLHKLNPDIDLDVIPAKIPMEAIAWPKQLGKPRLAGVSSFGISGTDGHTIIQEPPIVSKPQFQGDDVRPLHIMKISAQSPESFKELLMSYENIFASKVDDDGFADMAYSANVGRSTFNHRAVIIARGFKEAKNALQTKSFKYADVTSNKGQLCFLFSGEGSQYHKMGATLYATSPVFREEFNKCDLFLKKQHGIKMRQFLWGQSSHGNEMNKTLYHQLGNFCIEYCLLKLWESWGVKPDYVIGHGMGEYTAAVAAGALGLEDALILIAQRSRWIDKMNKSVNEKVQPGLTAFRREIQNLKPLQLQKNGPKYVSGMLGRVVDLNKLDADYWMSHITMETGRYQDVCKLVLSEGCSLFLDLSSDSSSLKSFGGQSMTYIPSIRNNTDEWSTLLERLAQLYLSEWKGEISWKGFDRAYHRSRVPLPFYPFNRRPIWKELEGILPTAHPLLGKPFLSASTSSIFEKGLTLKNTPFVMDHVIGNTVVFPGAGFMEMCLAGGHATANGTSPSGELQMPEGPVTLKALKIAAPLAIYDSGVCRLQTVIKLDKVEEEGDELKSYSVGVNRYVPSSSGGMGEWTAHATATFIPTQESPTTDTTVDIDIQNIQSSWEKRDNSDFYEKLPEVGLRFGPKFQSLEMGWKSEEGILLSVKTPEDNDDGYLIHPIIADAMLQATMLWTSKDKLKMKLQVPVQIGEFTWLQSTASSSRYIYCGTTKEGKTCCTLLDEWGHHLAQMMDVDFIETTVKLVEGMLSQQGKAMPKLWSEVWKGVPGPLQNAYDLTSTKDIPMLRLTEENKRFLAEKNDVGDYERSFYSNICNLARLHFLQAMYDLGWEPKQGLPFTAEELIKLLPQPTEHFKRYLRFFLRSMSASGMLKEVEDEEDTYYFSGSPPTQHIVTEGLHRVISPEDVPRAEYQLVARVGKNLAQVFRGNVEALQLLFPNEPNMTNASDFYESLCFWIFDIGALVLEEFGSTAMTVGCNAYMAVHKAGSPLPVFRVLEIGSGTGIMSKHFLEFLERNGKPYEYYYTDVSASFFNGAEKVLEKFLKNIVFKKFNMEEDPLAQGFCPGYFDLIIGCEVLHIAKDIRKTLRNLTSLLKPSGMFQIVETTVADPRISVTFGLLEGYWQFEDTDFRPYHATLTPDKWEEAFIGIGCDEVVVTPAYNNVHSVITARLAHTHRPVDENVIMLEKPLHSWIIFYQEETATVAELLGKKLAGVNRKVYAVRRPLTCTEGGMKELMQSRVNMALEEVGRIEGVLYLWGVQDDAGNRDQSKISLPLINLAKEMQQCKVPPRIYVVTQGTLYVDEGEVTSPTAATLHGIIKTLTNETIGLHWSCLDLSPDDSLTNQVEDIFSELWWTDKGSRLIAFRDKQRLFGKLVSAKVNRNEPLPLPGGCDRFQLVLPQTRLITDLEFGVLENYNLGEDEIEIQVKAIALNFRDIFAVLKPIQQFEKLNAVGLDFAGVVTKVGANVTKRRVGDRVIGLNNDDNLALPSHIKEKEQYVVPLPTNFTFEEGVTLPAVFSTAFHCLLNVAKMKRGDTVLIHTASGGVGLCAIQLAKQVGANIIATAGSKRKQNYLRNLGIQHVFHSRTTIFGKQILEVTNGRGVDIVLNSITGEGFKEASLSALRKNGWFVEMSKLNVWSPEEVKELRPDVHYEIVDLTAMTRLESAKLVEELQEFIKDGKIQPIAYERFDAVNIRGALNHLQKAKHIGKIVCTMPDVKIENSKITATTPTFNEVSTYLVTGGLGGIGFEVVKWMLSSGAKHIAIVSRSQPKPEIASQLEHWNRSGKHVEAFSVDVGDYGQCHRFFQMLAMPDRGFPKLRGVMHAAGTLADAIMENQSWDKFRHTYNPKVNGSWNLHELTKDLLLEHFVLFSSMTASFGTPGQSNHAASNCFEDAMAAYRISNGLPAITVNWGNWGEVGVATEVDFPGVRPISTSQGLLALETFLKTQTSHLNVINLDSFVLAVKLVPTLKTLFDDKRLFGELKTTIIINSDDFWKDVDSCGDRDKKLGVFKQFIKSTLKNILKMDQDEVIDDLTEFQSLGIDSLMMLEMKNGLQNILGSRMTLSATQLKDCNNTGVLANRLVDILEGTDNLTQVILPTMEELKELVREDSTLPEHIRPSLGMPLGDVSRVERVLLTGVTGVLGPYLLRNLTHRPEIKTIYCLIRKSGNVPPMERLLKRLSAVGLEDQVDMAKVECIQGDITNDKFGLSEEEYNSLSGNVDAIVNSAVRADHTAKYWRSPDTTKMSLRTVNVKGTSRLLEFAVQSKLKHVYHASTLLVDTTTKVDGSLSEEWQDVGAFDLVPVNGSYPLSKHIGEQLCKQAVERGIPCKVFRHPFIAGDSKTGRCDYLTNHIVLRWLGYLKLRCMPDLPSPLVALPVDLCAKISLDIFLNGKAPNDVYNIIHKDGGMDQTIIDVAEGFGIHVEPVSINQFMAKLKSERDDSPLAPFKKMYEEEEEAAIQNWESNLALPALRQYVEDSSNFFESRKLPQLIPYYDELESTEEVIRRDLQFLRESGVFDKFGIKYSLHRK